MLYRAAWIALFGCGLLGYQFLANTSLDSAHASQATGQGATVLQSAERKQDGPVSSAEHLAVATSAPDTAIQLVSFVSDAGDGADGHAGSWPSASTLVEQIRQLQHVPEIRNWSSRTISLLESFDQLDPNSPGLDRCLKQLENQVQEVSQLAASIGNRPEKSLETLQAYCEVSRMSYRLQRRIAVWTALRDAVGQVDSQRGGVFHSFRGGLPVRPASLGRISFEGLDPNWVEYLKLRELQSAFGNLNPSEREQKEVARSVLARIYSPVLKPDQAAYIQQIIDPTIVSFLKEHATGRFAEGEFLKRLEDYETQPSALTSYYLNDQYQNLLWSNNAKDQALASAIQMHYRNANFRFVMSERLMNRMIPELPNTAAPVNQSIKGARVSGHSEISNRLRVDLVPNEHEIDLLLATTGDVQSDTVAKTKSFRIQNLGKARFQVVQRVTINPEGIDSSSSPRARSEGNQYVVGVESKMDNLPFVGWMARKLATKKLREEAPDYNRIFKRTIESSAEKQMREQVNQQVAKLRYATYTKLFQPLFNMDLDPAPMQLSTTEEQIVMRYRLAGQDQMAANTARPRDSGDSLLSFQVHQSAINNLIARIGLNGNEFTIDELSQHLRDVAGLEPVETQNNDQYAEIGFAPFDPIHIDFDDDRLVIKLNLKTLKIGETGKVWKRLSLTAKYRIAIDGMNIRLIQDDDGTLIRGRRLRLGDKAAISTVMKVLFKQEYSLKSLPKQISEKLDVASMHISQLVASDGWLAVSVDDRDKDLARREDESMERTGTFRRLIQRR